MATNKIRMCSSPRPIAMRMRFVIALSHVVLLTTSLPLLTTTTKNQPSILEGDNIWVRDLADPANIDSWIKHPAVGEPSFDAFVQNNNNPVYIGSEPYLWPVNGFIYSDTTAEDIDGKGPHNSVEKETLYVGLYKTDYAKNSSMLALKGMDDGNGELRWVNAGYVCSANTTLFGIAYGCPDGSVVPDGSGGVHMVFDWSSGLGASTSNADNGLGYQHCVTPTGPCTISPTPVNRMIHNNVIPATGTTTPSPNPCTRDSKGYCTTYGGTLIKRENDWLVLTAISTPGNRGGIWALAALTATDPKGPYTVPQLVLYPESPVWHPHPCEFYPCFVHNTTVYCPCTSLQANRGYQVLFQAPIDKATDASAWEVAQDGSFYHWEGGEHDQMGIWGQTFSAFVTNAGLMKIMYPAKNSANVGTINLASRPFSQGLSHGFWVSAPNADSIAIMTKTLRQFSSNATVTLRAPGVGWTLRWNFRGEIGTDTIAAAGSPPSSRVLHNNTALCFDGRGDFALVQLGGVGAPIVTLAKGQVPVGGATVRIRISQSDNGHVTVVMNDTLVVTTNVSPADAVGGAFALHATKGASIHVTELDVVETSTTPPKQQWFWLTPSDGITGAGTIGGWSRVTDDNYRTGQGYETPGSDEALAKWNFFGVAATLWFPKGPDYCTIMACIDGHTCQNVSLYNPTKTQSLPLLTWDLNTSNVGLYNTQTPTPPTTSTPPPPSSPSSPTPSTPSTPSTPTTSPPTSSSRHAIVVRWVKQTASCVVPVDSLQFHP